MKHIKLFEQFINEKWSDHRDEWDADSRTTYDRAAEKFAKRAIAMRIAGDNVTDGSNLDTLKKAAATFAPNGMNAKEFFIAAAPNAGLIPKDPTWDALARTDHKKWDAVRAQVAIDLWDGKLTESLNEDAGLIADVAIGVAVGVAGLWALVKSASLVGRVFGDGAEHLANKFEKEAKMALKNHRKELIGEIVKKFDGDTKLAQMYQDLPPYTTKGRNDRARQLTTIGNYIKSKLTPEEMKYFTDISSMLRTGDIY
jgi:hypothetical protein